MIRHEIRMPFMLAWICLVKAVARTHGLPHDLHGRAITSRKGRTSPNVPWPSVLNELRRVALGKSVPYPGQENLRGGLIADFGGALALVGLAEAGTCAVWHR